MTRALPLLAVLLVPPVVAHAQQPVPIDALQSVTSDVGGDPQWLPDGRIAFVNGRDGTLSAITPETGAIARLDPAGGPRGLAHLRVPRTGSTSST